MKSDQIRLSKTNKTFTATKLRNCSYTNWYIKMLVEGTGVKVENCCIISRENSIILSVSQVDLKGRQPERPWKLQHQKPKQFKFESRLRNVLTVTKRTLRFINPQLGKCNVFEVALRFNKIPPFSARDMNKTRDATMSRIN